MPYCDVCERYNYLSCSHGTVLNSVSPSPLWVEQSTMHYFCRTCMQGFRYYEEMTLHRRRESH